MLSEYQKSFWTNPLAARWPAQQAEDGRYSVHFHTESAARSWVMRFARAAQRELARAEKCMDLDAETIARNFYVTRKGMSATVNFLPKTCPIASADALPGTEVEENA